MNERNQLIPSEHGELACRGGDFHSILSEMASDLLDRVEERDEIVQPKDEPVLQWLRMNPRFGEIYLNSLDQRFFFFRGFWVSFKSMLKWDCELVAKTQTVGAEAVPEFCRTLTQLERGMGLSNHWEYRSPTMDEAVMFDNFCDGARRSGDMSGGYKGWNEVDDGGICIDTPFRLILARPPKLDDPARISK